MMTDTAGTRTRDRSDDGPWVVAGVDTHKDTHHVAAGSAATGAGLGVLYKSESVSLTDFNFL